MFDYVLHIVLWLYNKSPIGVYVSFSRIDAGFLLLLSLLLLLLFETL